MPTFSVIIPTYNSERFIKDTISSVLNQTFSNLELIIIDDGSTDSTQKILQEIAATDARIKITITQNSGGPTVPTNIGINLAQGKYITFLDHDDSWKPHKLQKLFEVFTNNPDIGLIGSNVEIYNETNNTRTPTRALTQSNILETSSILSGNYFNTFSMMAITKVALTEAGPLDTNLFVFADYEMMVRLLSYKIKHYFINEPLVVYRVHQNNASALSKSALRRAVDLERIITKHNELFVKNKKSLAKVYDTIARIYLYLGNKKLSLFFIKKAISVDIYNPMLYTKMCMIFFGDRPYSFLSKIKNKAERKVS